MPMKYIRDTLDNLYIFSRTVQHAFVAESLKLEVKSAGFCMINGNEYSAYGKSTSFPDKGALPDDGNLIRDQLNP